MIHKVLVEYARDTGEGVKIDARQDGGPIYLYVWIDDELSRTDEVEDWAAARRWAESYQFHDVPLPDPAVD